MIGRTTVGQETRARHDALEAYIGKINRELIVLCGMRVDDLPDYDYWKAFQSKRDPAKVAKAVLRAARHY